MKDYKVGEYYNFWVTGIGNHRIYLKDENGDTFSVYAYDFQTEPQSSSWMMHSCETSTRRRVR